MNNKALFLPIKFISLLSIFAFLTPIFNIGGFGVKLDLLLLFPLLFLVLLVDRYYKNQKFFKSIIVISILVFVSMLISNTFGQRYYGTKNGISIPTEFISFISKVLIMWVFYIIGKYNILSKKLFFNSITIVFIISLLFGLFQILKVPFVISLSELFASSDNQVLKIGDGGGRIYSITGNVLSWAGWTGFIFIYSLILHKNIFIKWLILLLSFINLLFTSSRGAIIALFISIIAYAFLMSYKKNSIFSFFKYIFISVISLIVIGWLSFYFYETRVLLFIDRFNYLNEAIYVTGRSVQFNNILQIFNTDALNYLFGLGKPIVDSIGLMEVEFLFILISYGVVGLLLQYLFVFIVGRESIKYQITNYSILILIGLLYYIIYSMGYFFLREITSGLLFWSILGYLLSRTKHEY